MSRIAKISLTSPIDNNVPTKDLLAVETEFFCFSGWHLNSKKNVCKQLSSL